MRLQLVTSAAVVILMTFVMLQRNQKKTLRSKRKRVCNKSFNVATTYWRSRPCAVLHLEKSSFFLKASYRDKNCYLIDKQSHK